MKKVIKPILFISLLIIVLIALFIGCFHIGKHTNIKRYNETPTIVEIEERSKKYMLNVWEKSGIELEFIAQELINEDTLVYYFKVTKPDYFIIDYNRKYYIKTVYKIQDTVMSVNRSWQFDRVMFSNYEEIKTFLEVLDE